ncbi:MAG: hypothetical protein JJE04_16510 [Acidobacteriia bacterium]|nr:hypothetical protein [Terriglobia bacterium]
MPTIADLKEQVVTQTPLILFDCVLPSGSLENWSTHAVVANGRTYAPRVLRHNLFELRAASDDGIDSIGRISITLANADSHFSQIAQEPGWKGARLTATFLFFDLKLGVAASESMVLFRGVGNPPEEITESAIRLGFTNRLNLQRMLLPEVRIQRRCPWTFPKTPDQRQEALDGGGRGNYSPFFRCGYSADLTGGLGNLDGSSSVYNSCDYTRASCEQRGMFKQDNQGVPTRRFGGIEFVPASTLVRGYGEKTNHASPVSENLARFNDFVPLNYGKVWTQPPIVFSRNDGNLTRIEVLLGAGEVNSVVKVVVNDVDIPQGVPGKNMTATGWFNVVSSGGVTGGFNLDFADESGNPLGDPYGSMAYLSVVAPNRVNDGKSLPRMNVLLEGNRLPQYLSDGNPGGEGFTNNPAWIILDLLRRSGWKTDEVDLGSFSRVADYCSEVIPAEDLYGNATSIARYQCNLTVRRRKSAADLIRGVRNSAGLYLVYGNTGLLELRAEGTIADQQPAKPAGSNSTSALNGGWPAYEFGDGTVGASGILRRENGESSVRLWSRSTPETPNRVSIEFQDEFNEFQQDSLSLVDVEDAVAIGQEVSVAVHAFGIANFHQATRILQRQLEKSIRGNVWIQFETSVKSMGLKPGDLITITYLKEGLQRQPFRVSRIAPGLNHRHATIEAQIHDDGWYTDVAGTGGGVSRRQPNADVTLPRPLVGTELDENLEQQFGVIESTQENADGGVSAILSVSFVAPRLPAQSSVGIPYVSLAAGIDSTGGSIAGGQILYYAVTADDADGGESHLSFVVRASIPSSTNTNRVTLQGLRFSPGATGFQVYRGRNPQQMLQIATVQPVAASFVDPGLSTQLIGPPDGNYDHAKFEWRLEQYPETVATSFGVDTIGNGTMQMGLGEYTGMTVRIVGGTGRGQERTVLSHTANTITLQKKWDTIPDGTSVFVIAESSWRFGATSKVSPVQFDVPNREGATVQILGQAVNIHGRESGYELSPLTRWRILGANGSQLDQDVPPPALYGLYPTGQGTVELLGIAFTDLNNTRTISAGSLTLHYWNELLSPASSALAAAVDAVSTVVVLVASGGAQVGDLIQIGGEVMEVEGVAGGVTYTVKRGSHGSLATAHDGGAAVHHLDRKVYVMPFSRDFFGSPASGSYSYPIFLPDVRIAAADFMMHNNRGSSETSKAAFTGTVDKGIRTLSGGQFTIQVEGFLAIETGAAPPLILEDAHSVRDVFATVAQAPTGVPVELQLRVDNNVYTTLTIPVGATISNVVDGFSLAPLAALSKMTLNITSAGQTFDSTAGRDLTVTIRL